MFLGLLGFGAGLVFGLMALSVPEHWLLYTIIAVGGLLVGLAGVASEA